MYFSFILVFLELLCGLNFEFVTEGLIIELSAPFCHKIHLTCRYLNPNLLFFFLNNDDRIRLRFKNKIA